jgi:hypothetical protein
VAHAYNPNYLGGRNQEDRGSKPVLANSSPRPYLEKTQHKMAGGMFQGIGLEFKPQYCKKKKSFIVIVFESLPNINYLIQKKMSLIIIFILYIVLIAEQYSAVVKP